MSEWQPIETAPKDGTEVLGYRDDAGPMLISYGAPIDFLSDAELEELGEESGEAPDWFGGDSLTGGWRLDGSEKPTHWMPLPEPPK